MQIVRHPRADLRPPEVTLSDKWWCSRQKKKAYARMFLPDWMDVAVKLAWWKSESP